MKRSDLYIQSNLTIPAAEISVQTSTSGGPGGQHANKTSTKVTLRWNLKNSPSLREYQRSLLLERLHSRLSKRGEIIIQCDETRSQYDNFHRATQRLIHLVQEGLRRQTPRKKTKPSRSAKAQRLDQKKRRSQTKQQRQKPRE